MSIPLQQYLLSKYGTGAVFPSAQTSVSQTAPKPVGPIITDNVSSQKPPNQTRDFLDPHVTGTWSRRNLGAEKGMISTPNVPGPGSRVNSQIIESKISQASYTEGKVAALRAYGLYL